MSQPPFLSRRRLLTASGVAIIAAALPPRWAAAAPGEMASDGFRLLRARTGEVKLRGSDQPATAIWGYDGTVPGPLLRVKRGEEVKVRLLNELSEPTVIHWHGLRLPNAMDGVPHLTQEPVAPGKSFDYRFVAPDAGTFWYHTHFRSSGQLGRGLYGALIVDEPEPITVDQDLLLVVDDWRLTDAGAIHESFGAFHDASHAGRLGQYLTVNSRDIWDIPVRTNERLRLRLINVANARVMILRLDRHRAKVIAIDGQPSELFDARDSRVTLGPGARIDLLVDATLEAGTKAPFVLEYGRGEELVFARLSYAEGAPVRPAPLGDPKPLPANPLPERMDLANAFRMDVPLDGGAMSMMMSGMGGGMMGRGMGPGPGTTGINPQAGMFWALAGRSSTGHDGPPLFQVKRGRTVVLNFPNRTAFPHAMHVHGHHFRLLDRLDDGWKPYWLDTVLVEPRQGARIAFVADNPGKWLIHCHMIEHMETGMAAWFDVT
jgi:FtsP/CotA-like multicopper oxidase with cupredoxin domain